MAIYTTVQGDTFDTIARATYAGVEVFVPEVSEEASFVEADDLPEWRR